VVVAPDPHADHEISRKTDEQGIAVLLSRPRLAECRDRKRGAPAGAFVRGGIEQVEHRHPVAPLIERTAAAEEGRKPFSRLLLGKAARQYRIMTASDGGI